jgi:hypothetical protein
MRLLILRRKAQKESSQWQAMSRRLIAQPLELIRKNVRALTGRKVSPNKNQLQEPFAPCGAFYFCLTLSRGSGFVSLRLPLATFSKPPRS